MSHIFGGGGSNTTTVVQAPAPLPPPTLPDPNSPANIAAGQLQQRQNAQRDGRNSSILTTPGSRPSTIASGSLGGGNSNPGAGTPGPSFSNTSL